MGGYGFWNGKEEADICAVITNTPSRLWGKQAEECDMLIDKQFNAFAISVYFVLGLWFLHRIAMGVMWRYMFLKPMANDIADAMYRLQQLQNRAALQDSDDDSPKKPRRASQKAKG